MVMVMARIYANCGMYEDAIDELAYLLSMDRSITTNNLKLWYWIDPFRDHPRYRAMVEKYGGSYES